MLESATFRIEPYTNRRDLGLRQFKNGEQIFACDFLESYGKRALTLWIFRQGVSPRDRFPRLPLLKFILRSLSLAQIFTFPGVRVP